MEKIWKMYDDKANAFFTRSFENKDLISYNGFDFIYREIYNWEHSETNCIYEMWDCKISPNDIVVDLGANSGFFTVKSAEIASKVISIDGSPESYSCLVENCRDLPNVQTLNASILSKDSNPSHLWSHKGNPLRMTLEEMINAIERLQVVYDKMAEDEQREAKQFVRWAIKHLADKLYMAAL